MIKYFANKLDNMVMNKIIECFGMLVQENNRKIEILTTEINRVCGHQTDITEYCNHTHQIKKKLERIVPLVDKFSAQISYLFNEIDHLKKK